MINIAVAALLFGAAASLALLTGLGGRHVAGEVAAGRVWRRSLEPGDRIRARGVAGVDPDGATLFVPNTKLMETVVERTRSARPTERSEVE